MATLNGGRGWLSDEAAASIHRMDSAYGGYIPINSAGRTYKEQQEAYQKYLNGGPLALRPGTSVHETGNAVDFRNDSWGWLGSGRGLGWNGARANEFGWRRTVSSESWHFEYDPVRDKYRGQGGGGSFSQDVKNRQEWLNRSRGERLSVDGIMGPATTDAIKRYQEFLRAYGYSGGIDGDWGQGTQDAHQKFYNEFNAGGGSLVVDGEWGAATTRKLQQAVGVNVDGEMGPITVRALQARLGVEQDGQMGPATITALQRVVGSTPDGQMGPNTVKSLQNYLNAGGRFDTTPTPSNPAPPTSATLEVDGQMGPATIRAFQAKLGVTVDGELGPQTWTAFQNAVGITADGQPGPQTYKALQTLVDVVVDGQLGPETIKGLQRFLNSNGTFRKIEIPAEPIKEAYPKPANATYPESVWWGHSPNSSPRRTGDKVKYFVIHHAADPRDLTMQRDRFMNANDRNVSPNWLIGKDGSVSEIVPPDNFRAWTTGQFDYNAVTVETQNTSGDPTWGISEESHQAIAKLVAWASVRYGFEINRTNVIGHREVPGQATACPGPSMDLDKIVRLAKEIVAPAPTPGSTPDPEPTPTPDKEMWTITLPKDEAVALSGLLTEFKSLLP